MIAFGLMYSAAAKDNFGNPELKIPSGAESLSITFSDVELWDGKHVPRTMQCRELGGQQPASPKLFVSGVPDKAKSLVVFFENPRAHDNHGLVRVQESRRHESSWTVPPMRNNATADKVPKGTELFDGGNTWGKAYSAPCPNGGSWLYTVAIYALDENDLVVGFGKMEIGYAP